MAWGQAVMAHKKARKADLMARDLIKVLKTARMDQRQQIRQAENKAEKQSPVGVSTGKAFAFLSGPHGRIPLRLLAGCSGTVTPTSRRGSMMRALV